MESKLNITDSFNVALPADKDTSNTRRQVFDACFSYVKPKAPTRPSLVHYSPEMVRSIGLNLEDAQNHSFLEIFSGAKLVANTHPYAMCYGGHQFGSWVGQLGDGRAINLFEVVHDSQRWALQLKGAGETPYSRTADGLAVLRSSIREYLCSEAMFHLGVPTTRALSLVLSGDEVLRDVMYDGNPALEKGAIVCRAAPTFIRFGNFQILAARQDYKNLKILADYTIKYFFPEIKSQGKEAYLDFFKSVYNRTIDMVVHWQRVGFVHGVMNTDNMSILGLTIDYGPYGWLEDYDPNWTPNTTDRQAKRYRFGYQPAIAMWNLAQLASALVPLIESTSALQETLDNFKIDFEPRYYKMMAEKLGLTNMDEAVKYLIDLLERTLVLTETDMTIFFRNLVNYTPNDIGREGVDMLTYVMDAFYNSEELQGEVLDQWQLWFNKYLHQLNKEGVDTEAKKSQMNSTNPRYVLRNYMAQIAIDKADQGDYSLLDELFNMLKTPYDEQAQYDKWFAKRPDWARDKIGCSMLSCSS